MALPYVDVASPILQAYFQGKQIRMERERIANQQMVQQQKLQQEQDQMAQQQKQFQDQMKMEQNRLKQSDDIEKARRKQDEAQHNMQMAVQKAQLGGQMLQHFAQYGGVPKQDVQTPISFDGPPVNVPMNQKMITPFKGIPGMDDFQLDTSGLPQVPYAEQNRRDAILERGRIADENNARYRELAKLEAESRERMNNADNARSLENAKLLASTRGGGGEDNPKTVLNITKQVNSQVDRVKNSEEAKKVATSARSVAVVDDIWNRTYAVNKRPTGLDGTSLVLNYLQTVTPSNRITDFEFKKTAYSDSKIAELKKEVMRWVDSGMLTDNVARGLMHEIKMIHEANAKILEDRVNSIVDNGKILAVNNNVCRGPHSRARPAPNRPGG